MGLPRAEGFLNDTDFEYFRYQPRPFKIVRKLSSEEEPKSWKIESPATLKRWMAENRDLISHVCRDGAFAILFSRDSKARYSHPSYLPVTKGAFHQLAELFHIHRKIVRTISRGITYFSLVHLSQDGSSGHTIACTARMSSAWPDNDIAVSSTYLTHRNLNFLVFYGCSEEQSSDIERRLAEAGNAIYHPILASCILVELDRARLGQMVKSAVSQYVEEMETIKHISCNPKTRTDHDSRGIEELSDLFNKAGELAKGIRKVKRQISDICKHIHEPPFSTAGALLRERLIEIDEEYNEKLDECLMIPDGLKFIAQMAADNANIQIAIESRQENSQMRLIAMVTMVYLPLTSVASIFSMGVFNWGATTEQSVLTFYFWVYVAIGGGLTVLTVGLWWAWTRTRHRLYDAEADAGKSE
ncbi:hypothetical protein F4804DRAFT_321933 [Jackrogersella minutella]|nr:hypothetical protein F4804DRAFT_321933 [Jackrogersella minutella]